MIHAFRFWREQRRIYLLMDRITESRKRELAAARTSGADAMELDKIAHDYHSEQKTAEDELNTLTSTYYVRLANRLLIPLPAFEEEGGAWVQSDVHGGYYLTPSALHELRGAIRAERKARREEWTVWVALLVGVIGSLTALVAVWKR